MRVLRRSFASVLAAAAVTFALPADGASPALAQDLGGYDEASIMAALSSPITVAAGTTSTVSLPVAVDAAYSGGGWEVSASGGSVTITAPAEGGQVSVPVSALGRSATITLVATSPENADIGGAGAINGSGDQSSSGGNPGGAASGGQGASSSDGSNGSNGAGSTGAGAAADLPAVPGTPATGRKPAPAEDDSQAERIYLNSTITDNVITAKLGLSEAVDLYNRFGNIDKEKVKLRYLDGQGNIIEGVERDIDAGSRTLTLTYPAGQAPDNPFIMQLVNNDGTGVSVEAVLRDPNYASADGASAEEIAAESEQSTGGAGKAIVAAAVAGAVVLLALIAGLVAWLSRRKRA